ncbi:hypothetical protein PsYK624_058460 [Phanerochaete sordida]|uniref:Uncharacterized protein n=1 Tax=Phanerochaete sordida TaxID=48140 RepID=A0A9P3LC03_9APHY|nr:hypothetical protein PsYK624_058460 [Phanerochaete sordida]
MSSSCAAVIYAEQLVSRGYGLPLWHPEPTKFGEVELGDVGFVSEGSFIRLFNAMRPAHDPINDDGVPPDFVILQVNERLLHSAKQHVSPGPICTTTTTYRKLGAEVSCATGIPGPGASYTFSCHSSRGAIAVLGGWGHQTWYMRNRAFRAYIAAHHASWHAFALDRGYDVPPDALVLVSGTLKTAEWAVATVANASAAHDLSFSAAAGLYAHAAFEVSLGSDVSMSVEQRSGPPPDDGAEPATQLPHNQCMFLRYYKIKTRALGRPKITVQVKANDMLGPWQDDSPASAHRTRSRDSSGVGSSASGRSWLSRLVGSARQLAGRPKIPDSDASSSGSSSSHIEEIPQAGPVSSIHDPVDVLLDHILENSEADIAIACHEDAYEVFSEDAWPNDLSQSLADNPPTLDLESSGTNTTASLASPSSTATSRPLTQDSGYASLACADAARRSRRLSQPDVEPAERPARWSVASFRSRFRGAFRESVGTAAEEEEAEEEEAEEAEEVEGKDRRVGVAV